MLELCPQALNSLGLGVFSKHENSSKQEYELSPFPQNIYYPILYSEMILFLDKATYYRKEKRVIVYLKKNRKTIRVRWFPKGFPEANPIEECWHQGKDTVLGSILPQSLEDLKRKTTKYY